MAIDDKAVLARMAEYASIPPEGEPGSGEVGGSSAAYASVPPLEDEFEEIPFPLRGSLDSELGEAPEHPSKSMPSASELIAQDPDSGLAHAPQYEPGPSPLSHVLPPPPTKSRLAAAMFYEYPASFEDDIVNVEPVMGPSAPPFEDAATAAASAPPIAYDYMLEDAVLPSAPDLVLDEGEAIEPGHDPHYGRSVSPPRPPSLSLSLSRPGTPSGQSRTSGLGPPCYPA